MLAPESLISKPEIAAEHKAPLEGVLRSLWRLVQGITIYDANHPAAQSAAADAVAASVQSGDSSACFPLLRVTPEGFVCCEDALSREPSLIEFARLLHRLRIAMLGIPTSTTPAAFLTLASMLAGKKAGEHWTDQDSSALSTGPASAFRVYTVTYDSLRTGGTETEGTSGRFDWNSLVGALCPGSDNASADELALAIECSLKSESATKKSASDPVAAPFPPSDSSALARKLALTIKTIPDSQRQAAVTRVSAVIERLSPEGRARLLRIDESRATDSIATVSDLCDSADAGDILLALDRVGDPSKLVCAESVRLLTKIAITARGDPGITSGLRQVVSRATGANSAARSQQIVSLLRSFQELMERTSPDRFNPDDYEQLLQQLSSTPAAPASCETLAAIRDRWSDPCIHTAHLLGELAASQQTTPAEAVGIYRRLHTSLDVIADSGGTELLLLATRETGRYLSATNTPKTTAAIRQFTLRLQAPEALRRILISAPPDTASGSAAMDLIATLGPETVSQVLRFCTHELARADVPHLPVHPAVDTSEVMSHLLRSDMEASIRLLRAGTMPVRAQAVLAPMLIGNPDPEVSADAFATLHASEPLWTLEQISAALRHTRHPVRVFGIDKCRCLAPEQRHTLLKPVLSSSIKGPIVLTVLSAAVQTLADSGADGQRIVIAFCGMLLRWPKARHVDALLIIMDVLCDRSTADRSGRKPIRRLQLFLAVLRAALNGARP